MYLKVKCLTRQLALMDCDIFQAIGLTLLAVSERNVYNDLTPYYSILRHNSFVLHVLQFFWLHLNSTAAAGPRVKAAFSRFQRALCSWASRIAYFSFTELETGVDFFEMKCPQLLLYHGQYCCKWYLVQSWVSRKASDQCVATLKHVLQIKLRERKPMSCYW